MLKWKVCMLGAFGVGKTSLVQQYVSSVFSEKYLTTVGVRVEKKTIHTPVEDVVLMIWDIQGEDEATPIPPEYLAGAAGYLLVADVGRPETVSVAADIRKRMRARFGDTPSLLLVNKCDDPSDSQLPGEALSLLKETDIPFVRTSAKTGLGVENAFAAIVRLMSARMPRT